MKKLVVYDSVFGNTEKIAHAVGDALGSPDEVQVLRVTEVKPEHLAGVELLVVGSPTRGFQPTPAATEFLKNIPMGSLKGVSVAAFDTRIAVEDTSVWILRIMAKIFGYAAVPIDRRLKRRGGTQVLPPEGFYVKDSEGPLKDGELERAAQWGQVLAK